MARKGDLIDSRMLHDRGSGLTITGHDIDDSVREARFLSQFRHPQTAERRLFCRFHDDRTACGKCRAPLPGGHQDWKVPGDDLACHPDRFPAGVAEVIAANRNGVTGELVCPTSVIPQAINGERQVGGFGVADRFAVIQRFESREFIEIRFHQVGEFIHQPAPIAGIHRVPGTGFKRGSSRFDCGIDIGGVAVGNLGNDGFVDRIDRGKALPTLGFSPLTTDQHLGLTNFGWSDCCGGHKSSPNETGERTQVKGR